VPLECKKFDEFPDIARNDEKARLDNFAIELQNDPTATAYVVVYPGRNGRSPDVQKHTSRVVEYLTNWLPNHTRVADRMMAAALRNHERCMWKVTFQAGTKPAREGKWVTVTGEPFEPPAS